MAQFTHRPIDIQMLIWKQSYFLQTLQKRFRLNKIKLAIVSYLFLKIHLQEIQKSQFESLK